jgi:dipeptidyl aminopeptidase/acylaminoacyl peptidase
MKEKRVVFFILFLFVVFNLVYSQDREFEIKDWLILKKIPATVPIFSETDKKFFIKTFFETNYFNNKNQTFFLGKEQFEIKGKKYIWNKLISYKEILKVEKPSINFLSTYIDTDRFTEGKIVYNGNYPVEIFLDGKQIIKNRLFGDIKTNLEKRVKLINGKHLLFVKMIIFPEKNSKKRDFSISFISDNKFKKASIFFSVEPRKKISLKEILDVENPAWVKISPSGNLFALSLRKRDKGRRENWIEIREIKKGKIITSFKGLEGLSNFKWRPDGKRFSFLKREKKETLLYLSDIKGKKKVLFGTELKIQNYYWTPDNKKIIFSVGERGKEYIDGVKQLLNTEDRQKRNRDKSFLYVLYVNGGFVERLTTEKTVFLLDINKKGDKILFSVMNIDYKHRPYMFSTFYILNLNTLKKKKLFNSYWANYAVWLNDKELIVLGGPDSFGGIGRNLEKKVIANDYDIQAYLYKMETKKVIPITKNFKPSIDNLYIVDEGKKIFFTTTDRSYKSVFFYDMKNKKFNKLKTENEIIKSFSISKKGDKAVFIGNNSNTPPQVFSINILKSRVKRLYFPAEKDFSIINFGKVEKWNFKNKKGETIIGRIYFPPDFDKNKRYPLILYYYGGTSPVDRSFGGRYPKNYWAANGYIVYVLQPRGTTGFGQKFSSYHVNDWGKYSAEDILEGAKKFIKAHSYVKNNKIGIIGASYGGFMTEYLVTKTDMFAAAISHAGISLLPHYWGEGYWGYSYSAVATANSFPWNRKDIYVERSPLFNADKIRTPLLLLHGQVDTNVPTGESDQLYTALKLLGRTVEYIKIKAQNHWIMEYKKRKRWSKTIIAWFDRWLKNQPEYWYSMYKKTY